MHPAFPVLRFVPAGREPAIYFEEAMLDSLTSDQFAPFVNRQCQLLAPDGTVLDVVLTSVREVPSARGPAASQQRIPFNLVFQGPAETHLGDGIYTLKMDSLEVPGIFLNRIHHVGPEPACRFQAAFS